MNDPFCASSPEAQLLSDNEFWARVYPNQGQDHEPDDEDVPPFLVGFCLRCGCGLEAEDYQQLRRIVDQDEELCDDCTEETRPDVEDIW